MQAEYEAALTGTSHPASQPTPALAPTRNKAWDSSGGHRGHREDRFGGRVRCGSCGFGVVGSRWIERRSWGRGGAGLTALTVVVVEWSAAEQAVLDRGV